MTNESAYHLGVILGLLPSTIESIKTRTTRSANPAMLATDFVLEWLKTYPQKSNKETILVLEEKLRVVHLNSIIGKLRRRSCEG